MSLKHYLQESFRELHNVTWPTRKQAVRITSIVFIFMMISAFLLGILDELLTLGYHALLAL
ncbi:preprotein translocase subunit SecE [Candidatus Peregrinibacteria bacterium CG_4_10_14_0_2_um_filter_43_11]|nr:MAG: preprotein translocase subunit SecE [Candidatus Peregrinibacteria bacterium CG_4_10_14_0_2_um_filter_43_11]